MSPLIWSHTCLTGILAMDDQHGILMDTLNELRSAISHGSKETEEVLHRLMALSMLHFDAEESLMSRFSFPDIEVHRAEHQRLLAQLAEFSNSYAAGSTGRERTFVDFLRSWFHDHVEGMDQHYGPWLRERGVS